VADRLELAPLKVALRDLAGVLDTGPVPDVAPEVLARVRAAPAPRRFTLLRTAVVALVVSLLLALTPGVRTAVADFVRGLPGVLFNLDREPAPDVPRPVRLGDSLALSPATTLEEARRQVPFPVLVPGALGEPDEVYVPGRHAVTMLWRAGTGLPAIPGSDIGAVVDVIDPSVGAWLEKRLYGVGVERLVVNGHEAAWVGRPHPLLLLDENGEAVEQRLASRTLLVYEGRVTVRVESVLSRERAVAVATSLR